VHTTPEAPLMGPFRNESCSRTYTMVYSQSDIPLNAHLVLKNLIMSVLGLIMSVLGIRDVLLWKY
jgi:hypothetical protein